MHAMSCEHEQNEWHGWGWRMNMRIDKMASHDKVMPSHACSGMQNAECRRLTLLTRCLTVCGCGCKMWGVNSIYNTLQSTIQHTRLPVKSNSWHDSQVYSWRKTYMSPETWNAKWMLKLSISYLILYTSLDAILHKWFLRNFYHPMTHATALRVSSCYAMLMSFWHNENSVRSNSDCIELSLNFD